MYYNLVSDTNGRTLTLIFMDGTTTPVSSDHPNYADIFEAVNDDSIHEDTIRSMVNLLDEVGNRLNGLSERVSVSGNTVLFDGDEIRGPIADHIVRLLREGEDHGWRALVNFLEKIQTNPNEHSRESLYDWISNRNITITQDGDLIAYKGVTVDLDGVSRSVHSGTATVNGVVHQGQIPNPIGAVVEMPRSKVQHDTAIGCSTGLHAGTWEYASRFGQGRTLTVRINPRDVVSVPTDCQAQKIRVSRYEVLSEVSEPHTTTTLAEDDKDSPEMPVECDWCLEEIGDDEEFHVIDGDTFCGSCEDLNDRYENDPYDYDDYVEYSSEGEDFPYGV